MTSLTKNPHPPGKKFFSNAIYLTGRSFWAVEQLSSAIGGGARALVRQLKTAVFFYENHQNYPDAKVLSNYSQNFINFDHNFWTRNPSRSSKLSKDSNCSLVSNKNFSEILPSNGWRPRPGEVGQKVFHLWCHSQKNPDPPTKKYFSSANYKTCCVFWHFDQVRNANRSGDIPAQSHTRSSCFFGNRLN